MRGGKHTHTRGNRYAEAHEKIPYGVWRVRLLHSASVYMARSDQEVVPGMAKEVFEMRTLKEIKDALDRGRSDDKPCSSCAYNKFEAFKLCIDIMLNDARNCIC